jgi:hypothetical protein
LNFTMKPSGWQGRLASAGLVAALASSGCGGGSGLLPPASPEAAVRTFLNAVKANNLPAMSEVWGSSRGPAKGYMKRDELDQRLTVIRTYLDHEQFEILPSQSGLPAADGRRRVQVRLTRKGCTPVVPFTVAPYRGGWLVADIDLAAAGNPQRSCLPPEAR